MSNRFTISRADEEEKGSNTASIIGAIAGVAVVLLIVLVILIILAVM